MFIISILLIVIGIGLLCVIFYEKGQNVDLRRKLEELEERETENRIRRTGGVWSGDDNWEN